MSDAVNVNRRQWLLTTSLAAGSSLLVPSLLPALSAPPSGVRSRDYADVLDDLERTVTADRRAAGLIRLAYNENPFGMSPKAKDAISTGWAEHTQYNLQTIAELQRQFAKHVGVDPSNVLITQGSSETLSTAALAFGLHGGEVVTPWPTFEGLPRYADTIGAKVHRVPLAADLGHDFVALDHHITNAVNLVFVCNPNNPTSTLSDAATIRSFVTNASKRALVVVDEAYHDFVDAPGHRSMVDLVLKGENVIISRTASKVHGLAGLRIGFAIARPDILERMAGFMSGTPNAFGLRAAIASVQDTQYQDFVKAKNREGRALLVNALKGMGKQVAASETNFVFFKTGIPVEKVQAVMTAKGFLIGRAFPPYTDWCRISVGTPDEMKQVVAALPEAIRA